MSGRFYRRIPVLLAVSVACLSVAAAPCFAEPAAITSARKDAAEASRKLDDLAADLELRNEEYLEISDSLATTRARISQVERELESAISQQNRAIAQLNKRAATMYRNGPLGFLDVLLGVSDYSDLIARLDLMQLIGRSDATLVVNVTVSRERIEKARRTLETRQLELIATREQAAAKQDEVHAALKAQQSYLKQIDARLRKLIAQERERREREAARKAAEIAARMSASVRGTRAFDPKALGAHHPEAVSIARKYVGKTPYVWGGTTPAGFDCSGLVQYSYRKLGVSLPRTSRQQYRVGAFIPPNRLDLLMPGDLVFFGRGGNPDAVHHVAMYAGDGKMIHAPQAGEMVSVSSLLERIERRGDYVGACRP